MRRALTVSLILISLAWVAGCQQASVPNEPARGGSAPTFKQVEGGLKLDSAGKDQKYQYPKPDPNCSLMDKSGNIKLDDGVDGMCHLWINDAACKDATDPTQETKCKLDICANDGDCNDGKDETVDKCILTAGSKPNGKCIRALKDCILEKGICKGYGQVMSDGKCNAVIDMNMAQPESCDGKDNDCDGKTDETFPTVGQKCDGSDSDKCAYGVVKCMNDGSGVECGAETKSDIKELCNGADDDCDGTVDEDYPDLLVTACDAPTTSDGKDADSCPDTVMVCSADGSKTVCKVSTTTIVEICDGQDNNCDSKTDEGCDDDSDLYCDKAMKVAKGATCTKSSVPGDSSKTDGDDCDDTASGTNKGAADAQGSELACDSKDNDCDGSTDEGFGLGSDCESGKGECLVKGKVIACSADGKSSVCNAVEKPKSTEICDNKDNDCDGKADNGCDDDGDLFCDATMKVTKAAQCTKSKLPADDSQAAGDDCDDTVKATNPGASEVCDNVDNNCDTKKDDGCDDDGDLFCDAAMKIAKGATCTKSKVPQDASQSDGDDCKDNDKDVSPGAAESCDGKDNNCDSVVDKDSAGKTVCGGGDSCQLAKQVACGGKPVTIDFADNPNGTNAVETYYCPSNAGTQKHEGKSGKEIVVAISGTAGQSYTLWWSNPGAIKAFTFLGACAPDDASGKTANVYDVNTGKGVCSTAPGFYSQKGVVGKNWHLFEGDGKLELNVSCGKAP